MAKMGMGASPIAGTPFVPPTQPGAAQPGILASMFGEQGTTPRYEATMQLLAQAMSGAQGSNNPVLALLAPIASAAIGSRAEKLHSDNQAKVATEMAGGLLGARAQTPQVQQALSVLQNPDAPDYLKSIATTMLKGSSPIGGGGRRRSSGGGTRPSKLTYIRMDEDGVVRGYNPATGQREVVPNADATETPDFLADPNDPLGMRAAAPTAEDNDPLGLR